MTFMDEHDQEQGDRHSPRRSALLVSLFAAALLFGSGLGIGYLFSDPSPQINVAAETTTTTTVPSSTTAPDSTTSSTTPPTTSGLPSSEPVTTPLIEGDSEEPVADVAEALLPSIVQIETLGGVGSGVIYDSNGRILTAAHVVDGSTSVTVRLQTGDRVEGTVIGADDDNDIAVIEIDRTGLPAAPLALDEKPRVGQTAIALGSPWGLDSTVTAGILSAVDRPLRGQDQRARLMLQTDAPINPGNSGGALADRHGRVVGINVSIYSTSGANDGVGFAVPIERAFNIAEALVSGGEFERGYLGVTINFSEDGTAGAMVVTVSPDSAAAEADIRVGDIVVAVDGEPITGPDELGARISSRQVGEAVEIDLVRDGTPMTVIIELGQAPATG